MMIIFIYIVSVVMAGVFGHALAEHRESEGADKAASAAAAKTLLDFDNGKVERALLLSKTGVIHVKAVVATALFLGCGVCTAKWFAECRPARPHD